MPEQPLADISSKKKSVKNPVNKSEFQKVSLVL